MSDEQALERFNPTLAVSIKEHATWDGFWYNGFTALSLVLAAFSSVAANYPNWAVLVSIASAVAGLCIALERALGFGARWRFHMEMKNAYRNLQDGVSFEALLPAARKEAFLNDWWARLVYLRNRESLLPNTGGSENK
jgi:hypothetical protein